MQGREELQQVAQLLGAFTQVVQGFGGRVRGDRGAVRHDPAERAPGRAQGQLRRGGRPAALAGRAGVADLEQYLAPVLGDGTEPRPAQRRGQPPDLAGPAPDQEGAERLEVGRRRGDQLRGHRVEAEQVDVEVPGGGGQIAEPFELGLVVLGQLGGQHRAEQLDRRTAAADGDAQVVQELGVYVAEHAVDVLLQGVEQAQQQPGHRDGRGHRGGDLRVHPAGVVVGVPAERGQRRDEHALAGGGHARHASQQGRRPARLTGVAADFGDGQAQRQFGGDASRGGADRGGSRRAGADRGRGHGDVVRDQAGHRLAVGVEQPGQADRAGGFHDGQQCPRADQHHDPVPHRPGRQVQGRAPRRPAGYRLFGLRGAVGPAEQQPAARPGLLELEHQPGPVQAPVEGVQPGAPTGARCASFGGHGEGLRQRGQRGCPQVLRGFIPGGRFEDEIPRARRRHVTLLLGKLTPAPINTLYTFPIVGKRISECTVNVQ